MGQIHKRQRYDDDKSFINANNFVITLIWFATFALIPSVFQAYDKDETVRLAWTISLSHIVIDILQGIAPLPFLLLIEGVFVGIFFATVSDPDDTEAIKIGQNKQAEGESIWSLVFSSPYTSAFIFIVETIQVHNLLFSISNKIKSIFLSSTKDDDYGIGHNSYIDDDDDNIKCRKIGLSFIIGLCIVLYGVSGILLWNAFLPVNETYLGVVLALLCISGIGLSLWVGSGTFVAATLTLVFASFSALCGSKVMFLNIVRREREKSNGRIKIFSQRMLTNLEWVEVCETAIVLFTFCVSQFAGSDDDDENDCNKYGKNRRYQRKNSFSGYSSDYDYNGGYETFMKEWEQVKSILFQCVKKMIVIVAYTSTVINIRRFGDIDFMGLDLFHVRLVQSFLLALFLFCKLIYIFCCDYYDNSQF